MYISIYIFIIKGIEFYIEILMNKKYLIYIYFKIKICNFIYKLKYDKNI